MGALQWYAIPFAAGWQSYGSETALYAKDQHDTIYLNGGISSPTQPLTKGRVIATLPVGFRPLTTKLYISNFFSAGGDIYPIGLQLTPEGQLKVYGSNSQATLDKYVLGFTIPIDAIIPMAQ